MDEIGAQSDSSGNADYKLPILAVKCTYLEENEEPVVELVRGSYEETRNALLNDEPVAGYLCKNYVWLFTHRTEVSIVSYNVDDGYMMLQDDLYNYVITPDNTVELD